MFTEDELRSWSFIDSCALRFDGYKYESLCGGRMGPDKANFPSLVQRIEDTMEFYPDPLDNFAAFFALQRGLGKWGGEQLPAEHPARVAFHLLFLHLYREQIPGCFQWNEQPFYEEWQSKYEPHREQLAAYVRKHLVLRLSDESLY
ncbi:MAG TPA: hypothetical protein VK918_03040 [Pyrinomonadaceae bacterium]|nr:hypothetical protein [Pyrinomonadaceae bacterium]